MGNETKYQQYQLLEDTMQKMEGEIVPRKDVGLITRWTPTIINEGYANGVFKKMPETTGFYNNPPQGNTNTIYSASVKFDNSLVARTSNENRPKTMMIKHRIVKALI